MIRGSIDTSVAAYHQAWQAGAFATIAFQAFLALCFAVTTMCYIVVDVGAYAVTGRHVVGALALALAAC